MQRNLFGEPDSTAEVKRLDQRRAGYPKGPGHKEYGGASEEAADAVAGRVTALRKACMVVFAGGAYTADEVADILKLDYLTIRPRISELRTMGLVVATGLRRPSSRGGASTVWRVKG